MLLDDDAVEDLARRFDLDLAPEFVAEFNERVAMADHEVEVSVISNDLYPVMVRLGRSSPMGNYDELREIERATKAYFVYTGLISATIACHGQEGLVELRLWQLEAARRIAHEHTYDLSSWSDGERFCAEVWSIWNETVILVDDIQPDSPLAPVEQRINALMDNAAVARLDWSSREDVESVVRLFADELPRAAAKLDQLDALRVRDLTEKFRAAASHAAFSAWLAKQTEDFSAILALPAYLEGKWHSPPVSA